MVHDPTWGSTGALGQPGGAAGSTPSFIYNSYSGTDIVAEIILPNEEPLVLAELQTISYSIHRENTPVRFLGHVNASSFVKGPRTIAGSLIFTTFDTYAFYRLRSYQEAIGMGVWPLADMLPPFDVSITMANEYGRFSKMRILGLTVIEEGQTMSVDDLITEQTYTYMARGITPMHRYAPRSNSPVSTSGNGPLIAGVDESDILRF